MKRQLFIAFLHFSVLAFAQNAPSDSIDAWIEKAAFYEKDSYELIVDTILLQNALSESLSKQYDKGIMESNSYFGLYFLKQERFLEALNHFQIALESARRIEGTDVVDEARLMNNIASCYWNLGRGKAAVEAFLETLDFYDQHEVTTQSRYYRGETLGNLGVIYMEMGRFEESATYLEQAYEVFSDEQYATYRNYEQYRNIALSTLGGGYLMQGNGADALPYLNDYHEYVTAENDYLEIAKSYGNLAYANYLKGNFSVAYQYYEKSIALSEQYGFRRVMVITYKDLSDTYFAEKKYEKGVEYLNKHYALKDSIQGAEVQADLNDLKVAHETALKEQEIVRLGQVNQIQQQRLVITYGGFAIVLLLSGLLITYLVNLNRRRKEQAEWNALKLSHAEQKLSYQKKDITKMALEISKKHDFSSQLLEQLRGFELYLSKPAKTKWRKLENSVRNHLQSTDEKLLLNENVQQINQSFYDKLEQSFPELSKTDKEICSYLRLGLSDKEIAVLRGVSHEAVRTGKYRIRKKLKLDFKQDVEAFLQIL